MYCYLFSGSLNLESAGPWARRVLDDWFVCYPSSSFVFSLIVPTERIFDKSNFPPPFPPPVRGKSIPYVLRSLP